MTPDRRRAIEVRPDGSHWNHATYRMWLDQSDARSAKRAVVRRLSSEMAELQIAGRNG